MNLRVEDGLNYELAPNYGFLVYIMGPIFSALVGGGISKLLTSSDLRPEDAKFWDRERKVKARRKTASLVETNSRLNQP